MNSNQTNPIAFIVTELPWGLHNNEESYRAYDANGNEITNRPYRNRDQLAAHLGAIGYNPTDDF